MTSEFRHLWLALVWEDRVTVRSLIANVGNVIHTIKAREHCRDTSTVDSGFLLEPVRTLHVSSWAINIRSVSTTSGLLR
jgi:hypothetical protein